MEAELHNFYREGSVGSTRHWKRKLCRFLEEVRIGMEEFVGHNFLDLGVGHVGHVYTFFRLSRVSRSRWNIQENNTIFRKSRK